MSLTLRWSKEPLSYNKKNMELAQYHMVEWDYGNSLELSRRTGRQLNMSSVYLEFTFKRRTGFYILQVVQNSSNRMLRIINASEKYLIVTFTKYSI